MSEGQWSEVKDQSSIRIQLNVELSLYNILHAISIFRNIINEGQNCLTLVNDVSTRGLVLVSSKPGSLGIMGCGGMCCHMRHITS